MENFFQIIITKLSFKFLFGLFQLHLFYIYIQCSEFNKSIINNIILFNEENFIYLNFAKYSNGDIIFSSTANFQTEKRIFYGFKKNGRPFFQNETSYFYSMNSTKESNWEHKNESDSLVIKLSDESEKEYLISTGNNKSFCEIYDFENNEIYKKPMDKFANYYVDSFPNTGIFLFSNNSDHYYLFGFTIKENDVLNYSLQIHKFNTIENFNISSTIQTEKKVDYSKNKRGGINCFITEKQIIVCFYSTNKYYYIIAYNSTLEMIYKNFFGVNSKDYFFYKCIHLKEEVGVFSFYKYNFDVKQYYPILSFKQFFPNQTFNYSFGEINLHKYKFDTNLFKNDLIKLKEDKICFSSVLHEDFETTIYIILINLFENDTKYKVRYYSIDLYNIYNYKVYRYIKTHNYNNFISFAFSYCNYNDEDYGKNFSALMIFSYPNSTDNSSDLYEFLIKNYNSTINDFSVNLWNEVKIENNIFGYVFDSILIQNISNCLNIQFFSSLNKIIESNTSLSKDELIKLKFSKNNYSSFNCNIEYISILIEPDLKTYDQYPESIYEQNETSDDEFKNETFFGRLTYYYIYLSESLSDKCTDINCHLCLDRDKSFCITYKYNFTVEPSTKEEKNSNGIINSETVYFTKETEKTNKIYEYESDKIKTDIKRVNDTISFNTEGQEVKSDIYTNTLDKNTDKIESINKTKEETTQIFTDIGKNKDIYTDTISVDLYTDTIVVEDTFIETQIIINHPTETINTNAITEVKISEVIITDGDEKTLNKFELIKKIPKIIEDIKIGENYEMIGEDFILLIRPTKSFINFNSTHVDFSTCEKLLRSTYHIDEPRIITFLQLEIMNKNDKSLVNQVEYQAYDDNKTLLNLSICNNEDIQVYYSIKQNSSFDLSSLSLFNDLDIDILNIKDKFFTDICFPFSDNDNDIVLSDRIIDFYQNYSLCDDGCTYNKFDIQLMIINCNCSVKTNISIVEPMAKLEQLGEIEKSLAFEIIKCYNLFFSWKNKMKNYGFWIYFIFAIIHIPLLFIFFYKGFNQIKDYILQEMKNNGYISKNTETFQSNKKDKIKKKKKKKKKINKNGKQINSSKAEQNLDSPPKKVKNIEIKKNKNKNKTKNTSLNNNSSMRKMPQTDTQIMDEINKNKEKFTNILSYMPTQIIPSNLGVNKITKKITIKKDNNILNLCLINYNLNLNQVNKYDSTDSNYILNINSFEEAIKIDYRPMCRIFYIYLLSKQAFFHAFLYRSPLVLFPLRFCILIFIISSDLGLNAIFYFDDKISEKYRTAKNIFIFALSKNMTVILISTLIGFIFLTIFMKLSNSTNDIRSIFQKEEKLLKKNKKYIVTEKRKREILEEILKILKKYKIKVVMLVIIEILLLLFFWYYSTVFCHVYSMTQKSWILDSLLTMLSRIIIDCLLCLFYAKLYRVSIESNFNSIYKIALFFYCFC